MSNGADALMRALNKKWGAGTAAKASSMKNAAQRFTTGSPYFDHILGGGWPVNQAVEIVGMESSGKTAITLRTVAANQQRDPEFTTMWIAAEHYEPSYAQMIGVNNDRVTVVPSRNMEEAYEIILLAAQERMADLVVLDSYPALIAGGEASRTMEESTVGLGARNTGKFFRKFGSAIRRSLDEEDRPFLLMFVNQWRMTMVSHGDPRTTPGGLAKNFAFAVRTEIKRDEWLVEKIPGAGDTRVGQSIKIRTIKNKFAPPQRIAMVDFFFQDSQGFQAGDFDTVKEVVALGVISGAITRAGAYFSFGDHKWRGKDEMVAAIQESPELQASIATAVG